MSRRNNGCRATFRSRFDAVGRLTIHVRPGVRHIGIRPLLYSLLSSRVGLSVLTANYQHSPIAGKASALHVVTEITERSYSDRRVLSPERLALRTDHDARAKGLNQRVDQVFLFTPRTDTHVSLPLHRVPQARPSAPHPISHRHRRQSTELRLAYSLAPRQHQTVSACNPPVSALRMAYDRSLINHQASVWPFARRPAAGVVP